MAELVTDIDWEQFKDLSLEDRVDVTINDVFAKSQPVAGLVPDHDWGYSLIGIDEKFPLAFNDLQREPNNGLAFVSYRSSNTEAPAGVRVSGIDVAAYGCLKGVGVGVSWLKQFVHGASYGDWTAVNRITGSIRNRLYDERMVWSAMEDQTKLDTLKLMCGGNEDAAFSLLVVSGSIDAAKNLRPESWVKSKLPPQDLSWNRCR